MSEVVGYVLSFMMSFILLMAAIVGFRVVEERASEEALEVHFKDVASRVASGVLQAYEIGRARAGSIGTADPEHVLFTSRLDVPTQVRGEQFVVRLDEKEVTVETGGGHNTQRAPLFNLPVPACATTVAVCSFSGTGQSGAGFVLIRYEFMASGTSPTCATTPVNCITVG